MFSGVCYSNLSKVCPFQNNVSCSIRYCFRSLFLKLKLFSKILFQRIFEDFSKHYSIIKVHVLLAPLSQRLYILSNLSSFVNNFFNFFRHFSTLRKKRRRRDLNPRAATNDLLPFQGSPFSHLGTSACAQVMFLAELYIILKICTRLVPCIALSPVGGVQPAERVGFEPTRPCGQTVFKTASL